MNAMKFYIKKNIILLLISFNMKIFNHYRVENILNFIKSYLLIFRLRNIGYNLYTNKYFLYKMIADSKSKKFV